MGDRGVIECVEAQGGKVYLYTHWQATELPFLVAQGLSKGRFRWDDESYLNRILFDNLTGYTGGETGFGIATWCPGDAWRKVVVNHAEQTAQIFEGEESTGWTAQSEPLPFEGFIERYNK
jgi:hypothetical protein